MRLARVVCEGVLVTLLGALVLYELRHHLFVGIVAGVAVCLAGLVVISRLERRKGVPTPIPSVALPPATPGHITSASVSAQPSGEQMVRYELLPHPTPREPLSLTLREFGTYAEYRGPSDGGRPIIEVHVAVHAANPAGGVPIVLLKSRLEDIGFHIHGSVQIEGQPYRPGPPPTPFAGTASGDVRLAESDAAYPMFGHLTIQPGATHLLEAIVVFAIADPGEPHSIPQAMQASLVLIDELHGEHPKVDFACWVRMNLR